MTKDLQGSSHHLKVVGFRRKFITQFLHLRLAGFNPRIHEGCDRSQFLQCPALRKVLIHAPVRGATLITHMANQSNTF